MSKYRAKVEFVWNVGNSNTEITRSDFNELQSLLAKMSNDKFEFTFHSGGIGSVEIIADPIPLENILAGPKLVSGPKFVSTGLLSSEAEKLTRLQVAEIKIERILAQAEDLKSEIKCIRKGD